MITNDHSPEEAAGVLFAPGDGMLPHYLDGLPGIKVNLKRCSAIAWEHARPRATITRALEKIELPPPAKETET
jgi:hypothetical protein